MEFIRDVIGERDDLSEEGSAMERTTCAKRVMPLVIILDTVSLMDEASWKLLECIKEDCTKIVVVLLIQTDTKNEPKISKDARDFFDQNILSNEDFFATLDLQVSFKHSDAW